MTKTSFESLKTKEWSQIIFLSILLAVVCGLAYSNTFRVPFVFDDKTTIVGPFSSLSQASLFEQIKDCLSKPRPFLELTYLLNYRMNGLEVWGYHLVNLAIHFSAGLALFGLVKRTLESPKLSARFISNKNRLAFASAALWMLHPLLTRSVTFVSQRSESLMGLFFLLTFYCFARSQSNRKPRLWLFMALIPTILGMTTKQNMIVMPFLLFLYDRIYFSNSFAEIGRKRKLFYFVHFVIVLWLGFDYGEYAIFRPLRLSDAAPFQTAGIAPGQPSVMQYAISQPEIIFHYLRLAFWPHPLVFDYLWNPASSVTQVLPYFTGIILLLGITLIGLLRLNPYSFLGAWFFVNLAPRSSFVPIADLAVETRMYLPLIAVVIASVFLCDQILHRALKDKSRLQSKIQQTVFIVLAGVLAVMTYERNKVYGSEITLWQNTVEHRPLNHSAHLNLGVALLSENRLEEALIHFKTALHIAPDKSRAIKNVAITLVNRELKKQKPDYETLYNGLGAIYLENEIYDKAIQSFNKSIRANPKNARAYFNRGLAYYRKKDFTDAVNSYEQALQYNPKYAEAHNNLGAAYMALGDFKKAENHFEEALRLNPELKNVRDNLEQLSKRNPSSPSL